MTQRTHHLIALATASREQLIALLQANDPNGIYTDADCEAEGLQPLTREECLDLIFTEAEGVEWFAGRLAA